MLEARLLGVRCRLSLLFPALLTALLLWQPDGLAVSCVLASVMHECGHLLAMLAVGASPQDCTLGAFGMRIRLDGQMLGYGRNIVVSLAGPLTNGLAAAALLLWGRERTAAVHLTLAALNLLPAAALDGGEILRCSLCLLGWEQQAPRVLRITSALVLLPLVVGSVLLFLRGDGNGTLLIVGGYLLLLLFFSDKNEKTS